MPVRASTDVKGECILRQAEALGEGSGETRPGASCLSLLSDEALVAIAVGETSVIPGSDHRAAAFEALAARHYAAVRRVVRAVLGSSPDVEDAVQSTFLAAYLGLKGLRDRSRFKYWLRVIAVNQARDLLRDRVEAESLDALLTLPEVAQDRIPPEAAEAAWLIEQLNEHLPEQYMKVLYLRYYLEYTVNEVADMLGIQPGLVKWRADRARKLARKSLSDKGAISHRKADDRKPEGGSGNG